MAGHGAWEAQVSSGAACSAVKLGGCEQAEATFLGVKAKLEVRAEGVERFAEEMESEVTAGTGDGRWDWRWAMWVSG